MPQQNRFQWYLTGIAKFYVNVFGGEKCSVHYDKQSTQPFNAAQLNNSSRFERRMKDSFVSERKKKGKQKSWIFSTEFNILFCERILAAILSPKMVILPLWTAASLLPSLVIKEWHDSSRLCHSVAVRLIKNIDYVRWNDEFYGCSKASGTLRDINLKCKFQKISEFILNK